MMKPMRLLALSLILLLACGDDDGSSDAGMDAPMPDGPLSDVPVGDASTTGPEICDNGIDDDEDGDVDCADIDCAAAPLEPGASDETLQAIPFADRVRFLWEGSACAPLQIDVEPGAIDDELVGVIRGRVLDEQGNPLPGARIEVLNQSELGYTLSRSNGEYDIAVNAARFRHRLRTAAPPIAFFESRSVLESR